MIRWETRMRGNTPKFIDIFPVGAADSSGAIARVPIRDGYFNSNLKTAVLISEAPALLALIEEAVDYIPVNSAGSASLVAELKDAIDRSKGMKA